MNLSVVRAFARVRGRATTSVPAVTKSVSPVWTEVKDANGGIYYWNKSTNETTAVGAPNPNLVAAHANAPAPAAPMRGGLMGAIADGMATGIGFSMASRMMDGILGPRQMEVVHRDEGASGASGADSGSASQDSGSSYQDGYQGDTWFGNSTSNSSGGDVSGGGGGNDWGDFF